MADITDKYKGQLELTDISNSVDTLKVIISLLEKIEANTRKV